LSSFLSSYGVALSLKSYLVSLNNFLPETTTGLLEKIGDFFSNIVSIFVILVITFYMLVEENATKKILRSVIPNQYLPYAYDMFNRIEKQLGLWLRGQIILCFLVFLLVYIGLTVLGIKYALILAIIAGLFEFIPYLGPIFAGGVAVLITFLHSPLQAFWVLILYICIQILENNVLVPNIMRRAVGLNPVISIISLLIGSKLGGFIGAIIAIPLATALYVFFQDFYAKKQAEEMKLE
jgi:predicted PurR-regulated permease PerM